MILRFIYWLAGIREPEIPDRPVTFLFGPLDGMTEEAASRLPFTWGRDQGEIWVQYGSHRYYHTPTHWRWAGWVEEAIIDG